MNDDTEEMMPASAAVTAPSRGRMQFEVGGLDCADCARNLQEALNRIDGIDSAVVSFASAKATFDLRHPAALSHAHQAARDLGFVLVESGSTREALSVRGYLTLASAVLLALGLAFGRLQGLSVGLILGSVVAGGFPILRAGLGALKRRMLTVDVLVSVAVIAAVVSGDALAAAEVVVLMGVGEWLEERTVARSRRAVRQLLDLAPKTVTVVREGAEVTVPRGEVLRGDLVLVRPGGRVPVDGEVVSGRADVSEAPVTGESRLIAKGPGDGVFAGSLAQDGVLTIRATEIGPDTTLARIAAMIEEAQSRQAPVAGLVDRFAAWFIPVSLLSAVLVLLVTRETERAVTILIGACPCALVLSTPVAVFAAIGGASRRGLLVKGGLYLERLGRVDAVAFDKTGTLTSGRLQVSAVHAASLSEEEWLAVAAAVETPSEHPAGRAIVAAATERGLQFEAASDFKSHPGLGVEGMAGTSRVAAGSLRWLSEAGVAVDAEVYATAARLAGDGFTVVAVARDNVLLGLIGLADSVRADAGPAMARLRALGLRTWLLSGDSPGAAARVAGQLGISDHSGGLLPQDKVEMIARLNDQGSGVAMVGDGINDAPALAAASVGIAIGRGGSDLAIEAADVVLLSDDLGRVADAIELGRRTLNNIRFNIALSGLGIAGLFTAAALGYVGPLAGALVHEGSALLVTLNAMRLLGGATVAAGRTQQSFGREHAHGEHGHDDHDHAHEHDHDHAHDHEHEHAHDHAHDHAHEHANGHGHGDHAAHDAEACACGHDHAHGTPAKVAGACPCGHAHGDAGPSRHS